VSGCATVPRHAGFADVAKAVEQRTGLQIQQHSGAPTGVVADAIEELLRDELTLDHAVRVAVLNNRSLQATLGDLGIARADLLQAGLLKNPIFSGHLRFPRASSPTDVEFALAHSVLNVFFIPLRRKVAVAQFEQAKLQVADAVLGLLTEVKRAYYTVQAAAQITAMRQTVLQAAEAAAELAARQYQAGNIRDFDLANEQAAHHQAQVELARSQADSTEAREALNRLLGLASEPATTWRVAAGLPELPPADPARDGLETLAMTQRLDLAAGRREAAVLRSVLSVTRLNPLAAPEVGVSSETEEGQRVTGPTWEAPIPVFDWGQADISRAKVQLQQQEHRLAVLEVAVRSEIRILADRLTVQRGIAERYREHVLPLRQQILTSSQRHYNSMLIGAFQLLQFKQEEIAARQEYIEAVRDYWIAHAELERAVGGTLTNGGGS
jgi:cobalt-zinc-cadmium efflux system outer membrane protein